MSNEAKLNEVLTNWGANGDGVARGTIPAEKVPVLSVTESGFAILVSGSDPKTYADVPQQHKADAAEVVKPGGKSTKWLVLRRCIHCNKPFVVATSDLKLAVECREHRGQLNKGKKSKKTLTPEEQAARDKAMADLKSELDNARTAKAK